MRIELFDIAEEKEYARLQDQLMSANERLILCLDLMDLTIHLSNGNKSEIPDDHFPWITLYPLAK